MQIAFRPFYFKQSVFNTPKGLIPLQKYRP